MSYRIQYTRTASKALAKLPAMLATRIRRAIDALAYDPHPQGSIKLTASDAYRIRVGDYRIIYSVHNVELVIEVVRIGHRRDIYERRTP